MPGKPVGVWRKFNDQYLKELAESLEEFTADLIEREKPLFIKDWCFKVDVYPSRLPMCQERSEEFRRAYLKAKEYQCHCLEKGALYGKFNTKVALLWLANQHGWNLAPGIKESNQELVSDLRKLVENSDKRYKEIKGDDGEE